MINNLYRFSNTSWHVKLFTWIYGKNPTSTFNTMCPYFWSMVFTLLFFPLILVIKLFGKTGTNLLSNLESYKRDKTNKIIQDFITKCENPELTAKEAYSITKSRCWKLYRYDLGWRTKDDIWNMSDEYSKYLYQLKLEKNIQNVKKIKEVKESKYFPYIAYTVSTGVFLLITYIFYRLISMIELKPVDWEFVGGVTSILGIIAVGSILIILFIKYILSPLFDKLKCIELPKCKLCKLGLGKYLLAPFKFLGKGLLIVCDMIYMTYKKACPRIEWYDDKK